MLRSQGCQGGERGPRCWGLTAAVYCNSVLLHHGNRDASACGCAQPDHDPPAADGAAHARHGGRRPPAGRGAAEHPGAGRVSRHQSEYGRAGDRGPETERIRGGAAGDGGVRGPGSAGPPLPSAPRPLSAAPR
jgi:hypothetical protein